MRLARTKMARAVPVLRINAAPLVVGYDNGNHESTGTTSFFGTPVLRTELPSRATTRHVFSFNRRDHLSQDKSLLRRERATSTNEFMINGGQLALE